jgi:hypothetical protein
MAKQNIHIIWLKQYYFKLSSLNIMTLLTFHDPRRDVCPSAVGQPPEEHQAQRLYHMPVSCQLFADWLTTDGLQSWTWEYYLWSFAWDTSPLMRWGRHKARGPNYAVQQIAWEPCVFSMADDKSHAPVGQSWIPTAATACMPATPKYGLIQSSDWTTTKIFNATTRPRINQPQRPISIQPWW